MAYNAEEFKKEEKQAYDRVARDWNSHMAEVLAPYSWRLLDVMSPDYGSRLIDIGCGTGHLARQAVVLYACTADAIDISDAMLLEAKRRSDGIRGVTYRLGDAEKLEFSDNSFDVAASAFGVMYFPNARLAISEIRRVLRPGGKVGFAVWAEAMSTPVLRILVASMAEVMAQPPLSWLLQMPIVGERILLSATENEIPGRGPSPFRFGQYGKLEGLLMELGFKDLECTEHIETWRFTSFDAVWKQFVQSSPAHGRITPEQSDAIRNRMLEKAKEYKAGIGYSFPMKALLVTGVKKA